MNIEQSVEGSSTNVEVLGKRVAAAVRLGPPFEAQGA